MRFSSRKKFKVALASLFSASLLAVAIPAMAVEAPKPIEIPDVELNRVLHEKLGVPEERNITDQQMKTLTKLSLYGRIKDGHQIDLKGLEYAANLERLELEGVKIKKNVESISGLTNLDFLNLNKTGISSLTPFAKLTKVKELQANGNNLTNLSGIENMTVLEKLQAKHNRINDISALTGLESLDEIKLSENKIEELSPLKTVGSLHSLSLASNNISDISALRGVDVFFGTNLEDNHITDFTGVSSNKLGQTLYYTREGGGNPDNFILPFVKNKEGIPYEISAVTDSDKVYIGAKNGDKGIEVALAPMNGSKNPVGEELKILIAKDNSSTADSNPIATIYVTLKNKDASAAETPTPGPKPEPKPSPTVGTDPNVDPKPNDSVVTPKPGADTPAPKPGVDPKPGAGDQPGANPGGDTAVKPGTDNETDKDKDTSKDGTGTGKGASKSKDKGSEGADSKDKDVKGQDNSDKANQPGNPANSALATTGSISLILLVLATALIGVGTVTVATRRSAK